MTTSEKLQIMKNTVKPITQLLDKRMKNKMDALKAYEKPIDDADLEIQRMREIEAIKLRHEIEVLKDLSDIVNAMFPDA